MLYCTVGALKVTVAVSHEKDARILGLSRAPRSRYLSMPARASGDPCLCSPSHSRSTVTRFRCTYEWETIPRAPYLPCVGRIRSSRCAHQRLTRNQLPRSAATGTPCCCITHECEYRQALGASTHSRLTQMSRSRTLPLRHASRRSRR